MRSALVSKWFEWLYNYIMVKRNVIKNQCYQSVVGLYHMSVSCWNYNLVQKGGGAIHLIFACSCQGTFFHARIPQLGHPLYILLILKSSSHFGAKPAF